jgi:hypothetical protein
MGMKTFVVRCHYNVKELTKEDQDQVEHYGQRSFECESYPFLKRWKDPFVYGWKMRLRNGC